MYFPAFHPANAGLVKIIPIERHGQRVCERARATFGRRHNALTYGHYAGRGT